MADLIYVAIAALAWLMGGASAESISALTALVAVVVSPVIALFVTGLQIRSSERSTRDQLQNAVSIAKAQLEAAHAADTRRIRAELVSANRQAWINALRDCIADYHATVTGLAMDTLLRKYSEDKRVAQSLHMTMLLAKINLMLDHKNADERDLYKALASLRDKAAQERPTVSNAEFATTLKTATSIAHAVFERELARVRAGE